MSTAGPGMVASSRKNEPPRHRGPRGKPHGAKEKDEEEASLANTCCGTVSRPCRGPDRRSPLLQGDLRSAAWRGRETAPPQWAAFSLLSLGDLWASVVRLLKQKTAGLFGAGGRVYRRRVPSRKPSSCRLRTGCCSLRTALASIWRTRSRVTLKMRPTSSSV